MNDPYELQKPGTTEPDDDVWGDDGLMSYVATVKLSPEAQRIYESETLDTLVFGADLEDARENARREYGDRLVDVRPNI